MIGTGKVVCMACGHEFEILICEHNLKDGLETICPSCNEEIVLHFDWKTLKYNKEKV
jgi:DNA-directed RNA polymerase subunit RPC12/RpoP